MNVVDSWLVIPSLIYASESDKISGSEKNKISHVSILQTSICISAFINVIKFILHDLLAHLLGCSKSLESGNENTFFLVKSLLLLSIISHKINTFGPTVFQLVYPIMKVTFCKACKILLYDGYNLFV